MLVVPLKGDKIRTADDSTLRIVSSYTSLKDDPAVYLTFDSTEFKSEKFVFFGDIVEINGVRVEYDKVSKTFDALGPLRRKYQLPQPKDKIFVKLIDVTFKDEVEEMIVTGLRLHSKRFGAGRGLLVITQEGQFSLNEIKDIESKNQIGKFDQSRFTRLYFDYLPYQKHK